jgi:hypothetical protein
MVVGTGFVNVVAEVGVRSDSAGTRFPTSVLRSADGKVISFDFSPGLLPADETLFFFIRTVATTYQEGDRGRITQDGMGVIEFPVFQPVEDSAPVRR